MIYMSPRCGCKLVEVEMSRRDRRWLSKKRGRSARSYVVHQDGCVLASGLGNPAWYLVGARRTRLDGGQRG